LAIQISCGIKVRALLASKNRHGYVDARQGFFSVEKSNRAPVAGQPDPPCSSAMIFFW
jgi:hypothetical protein